MHPVPGIGLPQKTCFNMLNITIGLFWLRMKPNVRRAGDLISLSRGYRTQDKPKTLPQVMGDLVMKGTTLLIKVLVLPVVQTHFLHSSRRA